MLVAPNRRGPWVTVEVQRAEDAAAWAVHDQRSLFVEQLAADYAALRKDEKAWAEELREREVWETTSLDGLEHE